MYVLIISLYSSCILMICLRAVFCCFYFATLSFDKVLHVSFMFGPLKKFLNYLDDYHILTANSQDFVMIY